MKAAWAVALAAAACAVAAAAALAAARLASPDQPGLRVERARAAIESALAAERSHGADLARRAADACGAERDRRVLFDRLAPFEEAGWGTGVFTGKGLEAWAGVLPAGIEGWKLEGAEGIAGGSAYDYLWFRAPLAAGHVVAVRALRPRLPLRPELRKPCFPAEELAEAHGVGLVWDGEGERRAFGAGVEGILEPPGAARLKADARRGALAAARWAGLAALVLLAAFGGVFFLRSPASSAVRHLALGASLWGARALALVLDIPADLFEGGVFDPADYGTLRFLQVGRTAGEVMLTALVAAAHLALASARSGAGRPAAARLAAPAAFGALAWMYAELLASAVRDTPLDLLDPARAVPGGAAAALWAALAAGALACFLAARRAFEGCRGALASRLGERRASAVALAACGVAAVAGFRSPLGLVFPAWLALLWPRTPRLPLVAVGGVLAAALVAFLGLSAERDADARDALAVQADRVTRWDDVLYREYAREAAEAVAGRPALPATDAALLAAWAATPAARDGLALAIATHDGRSWTWFAVGMPDWKPADAEGGEDPKPQALPHGLFYDYTAAVVREDGRGRVVATVRAPADSSAPELLRRAGDPDRFVAFLRGDTPPEWSHPRFFAEPPAVAAGADVWRAEEAAGERWEVLYRRQEREGAEARLWAFARRLVRPGERAVRGLRALFIFALCGLAFGAVGLALARVTGTLPREWVGRLESRLTLALVAVSALPISAFGLFARELALDPVRAAQARLDEETAAIAFNAIHARRVELSAVDPVVLRGVEDLVGRDVFYYYNGALRAVGQPSLASLEIAPGYVPAAAYRGAVLAGRRTHEGQESLGGGTVTTTWVRSPRSARALLALPEAPGPEPREPGAATSLALGASTALALLLWPLSALLAARISGPVAELTRAAGRVEAGDLSVRVQVAAPGDVADLVDAFNRMTEGLERGREALARAERERAWREMARQVAHEIKNPLTPLKLALQNLRAAWRDKAPDFGAQLDEAVDLTVAQIDLLARIATNFSQFAGKPSRTVEPLDVNALLRAAVELFRPTAPGVAFEEKLAEPLPAVAGDRDELTRVFTNIVKNAVQAMPRGGTLTVSSRNGDGRVVVDIADTGVGIPEELRARMFEPYFSTKSEGTGLGLGIARRVVEEMGGSITFASEAGKGTTMTVVLPAAPP